MEKNIVLIGLMGCGKTTVAAILSNKLNKKLFDTDSLIIQDQNKSINSIFAEKGEACFRDIETKIVNQVSKESKSIISTGGGVVEKLENIDLLKKNGIVFYLKTAPETLYERLQHQSDRPLLKTENPLETLKELLIKRENKYNLADYIIETDGKNPFTIAGEIIDIYEKQNS